MEVARRDHDRPGRSSPGEQRSSDPLGDRAFQRRGREQPATKDAATQSPPEHGLFECDRRYDRQQQRELPALVVDLSPVLATTVALPKMPAKVRAPERRAATRGDLRANLGARGFARRTACNQRFPRLEDERLDLLLGNAERLGDLRMGEGVELGEHKRCSLLVRQLPHVADEVTEVLAGLNLGCEALGLDLLELGDRLLTPRTEDRVAAVTRDREQPGAQVDLLVRRHEVAVGGGERVLDGILRLVGIAEHVPAERQDRPMMAIVGCLEGRRSTLADQRHQSRIRRNPQ